MPEPLPPHLVRALEAPSAYPEDPSARDGVEPVQTHISHVFLTRDRVYKLRKAVDLGFLDFSTRAARNVDCLREVELNRRLAPDVYLGVAPLLEVGDGVCVGLAAESLWRSDAGGGAPEHCVVMRRLPDGGNALSLLQRGRLRRRHLDAVAERMAGFHARHGLGRPAPFSPEAWLQRVREPVEANFASLDTVAGGVVSRAELERARRRAADFLARHAERFQARCAAGRAVDGHGDLHLQHVWFEPGREEPVLVDCIEFNERLRQIDTASEVAFLSMDLRYRHRPGFADFFLRRYARASDDYDLYRVVDFFESYRAGVRAKVAGLAADEAEIPEAQRRAAADSARRHLSLAGRALRRPGPGALVLTTGVVGTGKSTLAEVAADALGGVVIASDRVRKRLAGLEPLERGDGTRSRELYNEAASERTYAGLLERAAPVVDSGRTAVLDATYARAGRREAARAWALERGLPALLVEVRCTRDVALERLARRQRDGRDPSDAGPELYAHSIERFDPAPGRWPEADHLVVRTDGAGWREEATRRLRAHLAGRCRWR